MQLLQNKFTPKELSLLLGKGSSICIDKIKVLHSGHHVLTKHTIGSFLETMGVAYCPVLRFSSMNALENIIKACPNSLKKGEASDLGEGYRDAIFNGKIADVTVVWLGEPLRYCLITNDALKTGDFIGCYSGLLRRMNRFTPTVNAYSALYPVKTVLSTYVIDARFYGNLLRYINHSDTPNLQATWAYDRGLLHLLFFAAKAIPRCSQLTVDYGQNFWKYRITSK